MSGRKLNLFSILFLLFAFAMIGTIGCSSSGGDGDGENTPAASVPAPSEPVPSPAPPADDPGSPVDNPAPQSTNNAPVANAGADQNNVMIGCSLQFSGSGSSDPDGDALTYSWSVISAPADSSWITVGATNETNLTVTPDLAGNYSFQLTVSDGTNNNSDTANLIVLSASAFPTRTDCYENDDDRTTANAILDGGPVQVRTIYPVKDEDWIAVNLTGGTQYELFTTNLNETGDTSLYLYDTNGTTQLDSNDDYISYDSNIRYTPAADGTYYLMIRPVNQAYGIVAYSLGVREYVDADDDGYSSFHDCNDNDAAIGPDIIEIPGDGIDQNWAVEISLF